jgi:transposase
MIALNRRTKVFVCKEPTRLNLSYDGLFHKVKKVLRKDPFSGHLFLFVNRRRNSCKALCYDGTGFCIVSKRMEQKRLFSRINPRYSKELVLTQSEYGLYFEGANLEKRFIDTAVEIKKNRIKQLRFLRDYSRLDSNGHAPRANPSRGPESTNL